ncbi:MAG: molybdate ABC transporter substrate-binding protein [Thermodesulfobacteriota bacterium]
MPSRFFQFLFLSLAALLSLIHTAGAEDLTVSAAMSLKNAFDEIGRQFEINHPGVKVLLNFGASGDLARQIAAGAPVDVFASAAQKDLEELDGQGLIRPGTKVNFAGNRLVLVVPHTTTLSLRSFQDLKDPRIRRVALGNPKTVPAGRYAQEVLTYFRLWDGFRNKWILADNVRQVLDYVARGEVDAALVYSTDVAIRAKDIKIIARAPEGSHQPILYPMGIVRESRKEAMSEAFVALVLSRKGKDILQRYGFLAPFEK